MVIKASEIRLAIPAKTQIGAVEITNSQNENKMLKHQLNTQSKHENKM